MRLRTKTFVSQTTLGMLGACSAHRSVDVLVDLLFAQPPRLDLLSNGRKVVVQILESRGAGCRLSDRDRPDAELLATVGWFRERILPIAPEHVIDTLLPLAHQCWSGNRTCVTTADVVRALTAHPDTPSAILEELRASPVFARYL